MDARYDTSLVKTDVTFRPNRWWRTSECQAGDWATVHWKASLNNHRVVADTREQPGG